MPYSRLRDQVEAGNVAEVTSQGDTIQGTFDVEVTYPEGSDSSETDFETIRARPRVPGHGGLAERLGRPPGRLPWGGRPRRLAGRRPHEGARGARPPGRPGPSPVRAARPPPGDPPARLRPRSLAGPGGSSTPPRPRWGATPRCVRAPGGRAGARGAHAAAGACGTGARARAGPGAPDRAHRGGRGPVERLPGSAGAGYARARASAGAPRSRPASSAGEMATAITPLPSSRPARVPRRGTRSTCQW